MSAIKRSLTDIKTELVHNHTTYRKALVANGEKHPGTIATINYAWIEPGKQLTPHRHPDGEEFYLFLQGTGKMLVGETWLPVTEGDFITVPPNTLHSVKSTTKHAILFITIRTMVTRT